MGQVRPAKSVETCQVRPAKSVEALVKKGSRLGQIGRIVLRTPKFQEKQPRNPGIFLTNVAKRLDGGTDNFQGAPLTSRSAQANHNIDSQPHFLRFGVSILLSIFLCNPALSYFA